MENLTKDSLHYSDVRLATISFRGTLAERNSYVVDLDNFFGEVISKTDKFQVWSFKFYSVKNFF
jgi:hypothetical protein